MTYTKMLNSIIASAAESDRELSFYENQIIRYLESDSETRQKSKEHWLKCHAENVLSGRDDLIMFTSKILAAYMFAEYVLAEQI